MTSLPSKFDYSDKVTLIRKQTGGGCGGFAAMAIMDILKELEYRYSPDVSYRFSEYVYNMAMDNVGYRTNPNVPNADSRVVEDKDSSQGKVAVQYGVCPEASCFTNYDQFPRIAFCGVRPSNENFAEANEYKLAAFEPPMAARDITIEQVKEMLYKQPLWTNNFIDSHCVAFIGWDDNVTTDDGSKGGFLYIDCTGENIDRNALLWYSYNRYTERVSGYYTEFRILRNDKTPFNLFEYTGRVRIRTDNGRRYLAIKVGVEGQSPKVVWDRPNQIDDDSHDLAYDFPLPKYASDFWPPNDREHDGWYLEVTDSSKDGLGANKVWLDEITLVKRSFRGPSRGSRGLPPSRSRKKVVEYNLVKPPLPPNGMELNSGGSIKIYIPPVHSYNLRLTNLENKYAKTGQTKTLWGSFVEQTRKAKMTSRDGTSQDLSETPLLSDYRVKIFKIAEQKVNDEYPLQITPVEITNTLTSDCNLNSTWPLFNFNFKVDFVPFPEIEQNIQLQLQAIVDEPDHQKQNYRAIAYSESCSIFLK